ncbi:hypothetical protein CS369_13520 [Candidatus Symbiopectobacterium sp. 'North America']|uniref:hypothetical protein n=1 Tax=Candidatus Symbiopectobacterium sp. 'North America' TaxID=2794574 RepID=UPI0018CA9055|nr:hypothetical protein [Candidatus Symbiopectobacterium sp. 'North America']MBG6245541.1 hypothetical protein [Candidatus Symbiopectobacterium sp. 'North America']
MIDIAELLKARKNEFISLKEFITRIKLHQPHVTETQIADYLYISNENGDFPEWVKQGIAGSIEKTYIDDSYESDVSLEVLLSTIHEQGYMPEVTPPPVPIEPHMDFDDDIPF